MNKKKELERLKDENDLLRGCKSGLQRQIMMQQEQIKKLEILLQEAKEDSKEKYTELLEKYITMMERMVRLNEQREAD